MEPVDAEFAEALDPFGDGFGRRREPLCDGCDGVAIIHNGAGHHLSTFGCQARILMHVHSVLLENH